VRVKRSTGGGAAAPKKRELPRPPEYVNGSGIQTYAERGPTMTIHMDAGSFTWLWQLLEARKRQAEQPGRMATMPEYAELTNRAYVAFCLAALGDDDEPEPAPVGRKVTRRKR
jgi:hypothetical protein